MFTASVRHTLRSVFSLGDRALTYMELRSEIRLSYLVISVLASLTYSRNGPTDSLKLLYCSVASWQA